MSSAAITVRFGAAVRNLRFHLGLSQEELAERADLHRTYIAGIESGGRNVTLKTLARLAEALGAPIERLLVPRNGPVAESEAQLRKKVSDILLVEHSPGDVEAIRDLFRAMRIVNRLHVVSDGPEALEYLFGDELHASRQTTNLPNLILLDLDLPNNGGLELFRRIKRDRRTRGIPVVLLAGSPHSGNVPQSRRLAATSYLVKPVNFLKLTQATSRLRLQWALLNPATAGPP